MPRSPFPHLVRDGLFPADLPRAALESWPAPDWPGWVRYRGATHSKSASDLAAPVPAACAELLRLLALLPLPRLLGVPGLVPDLGLWGAGLHEVAPGGGVSLHLDAESHPRLGLARAASAMLYLSPWEPGWGGELELWSGGRPAVRVPPLPGRLVAFANGPAARHAVATVTGPVPRRSLALFWYGPPAPAPGRPRAHFVAPPPA